MGPRYPQKLATQNFITTFYYHFITIITGFAMWKIDLQGLTSKHTTHIRLGAKQKAQIGADLY